MIGRPFTIAVLSGKGGTGKTFVSVNLASVIEDSSYIDCDVEEPNGHLFFKLEDSYEEDIFNEIPKLEQDLCKGCRKCVDFCKFHAFAFINNKPHLFSELCHSCGGCILLCPNNALTTTKKQIGKITKSKSGNILIKTGELKIGEPTGVPIIKKMLAPDNESKMKYNIIDCPPGSACSVMESIKDVDYCLLIAEPTIFGAHNLSVVHKLVQMFKRPCGVVLNKCMDIENPSELYCIENGIKVIGKIMFDHELGRINSKARIAVHENKDYRLLFLSFIETITKEAKNQAASNN